MAIRICPASGCISPHCSRNGNAYFGDDVVDNAGKVLVPGMELDTNFKYAANILLDLKAEEVERPETAGIRRRRTPSSFPIEQLPASWHPVGCSR
jgi:hypothetical protein